MTKSFAAQVGAWTEKAKRNTRLVVADAAQGVFEDMSQRQPSIKETGSFVVGKVPVDTGLLISSMFAQVNGATVGQGSDSYVAALAGMEMGDTVRFAFSQDYAQRIEYGFVGTDSLGRRYDVPGRFMVREAINGEGGWQGRVDQSAGKFSD